MWVVLLTAKVLSCLTDTGFRRRIAQGKILAYEFNPFKEKWKDIVKFISYNIPGSQVEKN